MNKHIPEHKRMAMGDRLGYKAGGSVPAPKVLKSGFPDGPVEKSKRANGVVGMKKGGKCSCSD